MVDIVRKNGIHIQPISDEESDERFRRQSIALCEALLLTIPLQLDQELRDDPSRDYGATILNDLMVDAGKLCQAYYLELGEDLIESARSVILDVTHLVVERSREEKGLNRFEAHRYWSKDGRHMV